MEAGMFDMIFLAAGLGFFAAAMVYVFLCEKL
jgi:hypothetical protein